MSIKHELLLSDQAIDQHEMVKKLSNSNGASAEAIAFMVGMRKARELYEQARAKDAELIQQLVDAGDVMKQWLGLTLQMDGESCPDCRYDWGKGHNYGCTQLQHQKAIDEWDAAAAGFKPTEQ